MVVMALASCRGCSSRVTQLTPAELHVEPAELEFPHTYVGHPARRALTVSNRGQQPGQVAWLIAEPFSIDRLEFTVGGGESLELTVEFAPTAPGPFTGRLTSQGLEVSLHGTGLEVPQCVAELCHEASFDVAQASCRSTLTPDETSCSDACVSNGRCRAGSCVGQARDCSDGDACTLDACGPTGCTHGPLACPSPTNPCRAATCDALTGCGEEDAVDGTLCGPDVCTQRDVQICVAGACVTRQRPDTGRCENTWVSLAMPARNGRAVVWDSARKKLLAFGGRNGTPMFSDTWEFDGQQWTQRFPAQSPPPLSFATLAFDSFRRRAVLFGGQLPDAGRSSETWEWDGVTWLARPVGTSPPRRQSSGMAYDVVHRKTVLFGGTTSNGYESDTWEWDGARWTQRQVPGPSARDGHSMVFDERRARIVLVGGYDGTVQSDLWEWDGTSWTERHAATTPGPRARFGLAYDGDRQRVVMGFGSTSPSSYSGEVWEWDGLDWSERTALRLPGTILLDPNLVWDAAQHRLTVLSSLELFAWTGAEWTSFKPSYRPGASVAFDSNRGVVVLFGGQLFGRAHQFEGELWEWDGTRWSLHLPSPHPVGRYQAGLVFDRDRNRVVLFGGSNKLNQPGGLMGVDYDDTWEWDGTSWHEVTSSVRPPAGAAEARLVFVPPLHRSLYVHPTLGRWSFDGTGWQQDQPGAQPNGVMLFDASASKLAAIAPSSSSTTQRSFFDGSTWTGQMFATTWRPDWLRIDAAFDVSRSLTVFHFADSTYQPQTWEFDGATFTQRQPRVMPPFGPMLYDSTRQKVMLHDGTDTWVYLP